MGVLGVQRTSSQRTWTLRGSLRSTWSITTSSLPLSRREGLPVEEEPNLPSSISFNIGGRGWRHFKIILIVMERKFLKETKIHFLSLRFCLIHPLWLPRSE